MSILESILVAYTVSVIFFMIHAWWNSRGYEVIEPVEYQGAHDISVTIIVPCRNEINNIETCLESLSCQTYKNYTVIVVDGSSTDGTREFIDEFCKRHSRFSWIAEDPLPEKWIGKSFGCWLGAQQAPGEWMLFVDADTEHHPQMLSSTLAYIQKHKLDFFSFMTGQKMETFWENVILPSIFLWFGTKFPIEKVNDSRSKIARATGQFIAIKKDVYRATSGHRAIHNEVVEDFAFAQLVKSAGYRIRVAGGSKLVQTRMYRSLSEIWEGFTKNIFFAAGASIGSTLWAILYILITQILPIVSFFLALTVDRINGTIVMLSIIPLMLMIIVRIQLNTILRLRQWYTFTFPLGGLFALAVHINSALRYLTGRGMRWKGRIYGNRTGKT